MDSGLADTPIGTHPTLESSLERLLAVSALGFLLMGNEPYGWWGTVPATAAPRLIVQLINWLEPGAKGLR